MVARNLRLLHTNFGETCSRRLNYDYYMRDGEQTHLSLDQVANEISGSGTIMLIHHFDIAGARSNFSAAAILGQTRRGKGFKRDVDRQVHLQT